MDSILPTTFHRFYGLDSTIQGSSHATMVTKIDDPIMSSNQGLNFSPINSHITSSSHLVPKGNIAFKPIQRRSRASKRTPTTLVNANTNNFRELVQQFTSCPITSFSKGPITLNSQQGINKHVRNHNTTTTTSIGYSLEHVKNNDFLQSLGSSRPSSIEFFDGLVMNNDSSSLHEQNANTFSYDENFYYKGKFLLNYIIAL
ncbi:hypothetical protein Lal_00008174 [Lupinus albus]|uniref:VQ domain-containing protein n=1 Tax=Lupinus albus TaxID=3870 RepID=A0A6A4PNX9_LUPAL|nr:hypothetical protein Lalb_Chr12g0208981 [Lupinus albus]KAF1868367.1 hypothetical protein Lal_00008174 [Lupinus albus]